MKVSITTEQHIIEQKQHLSELIAEMHFQHHPELEIRYGKAGREKCEQDSNYHLSYLAESIAAESPEIFNAYLDWAYGMLQSRAIPREDLINNLGYMDNACKKLLPHEDYKVATGYIKSGIQSLINSEPLPETFIKEDNPLQSKAKQYLELLIKGNRKQAQALVVDLVKQGEQVSEIYEHIFIVTQHEVGLLWQTNKITVAHEHFCTAATQDNMSALYPHVFSLRKKEAKVMACTVAGDTHEIGIRMVSDYFDMDGWYCYYLGANMPDINIISAAKEQKVNVLAISVTMPLYISKVKNLIEKIRNDEELSDLKILVGGYPFTLVPHLWKRVGAHGWAREAKEAVNLANGFLYNA